MGPERHQPARQPMDGRIVVATVGGHRLRRVTRPLEPVGERGDAAFHEFLKLFLPRRFYETAHAALPPGRFRNASMNGSISPSITLCTSVTFRSVRWSFTMVYGWNT